MRGEDSLKLSAMDECPILSERRKIAEHLWPPEAATTPALLYKLYPQEVDESKVYYSYQFHQKRDQ